MLQIQKQLVEARNRIREIQQQQEIKEKELEDVKRELEYSFELDRSQPVLLKETSHEEIKDIETPRGTQGGLPLQTALRLTPEPTPRPYPSPGNYPTQGPTDRNLDKITRNITRFEPNPVALMTLASDREEISKCHGGRQNITDDF